MMRLGYELTIEQTQKLSTSPELIQAIQILQMNQSKNHLRHPSDTCHRHSYLLSGMNLLYDIQLRTLCYLSDKHPLSLCKLIPEQNPSCRTNMLLLVDASYL